MEQDMHITMKNRGAKMKKKIIIPLKIPGDIQHLMLALTIGPREMAGTNWDEAMQGLTMSSAIAEAVSMVAAMKVKSARILVCSN